MQDHETHMKKACELSEKSIQRNCGPFGCIIIEKSTGESVGRGHNMVTMHNDPTLHAEMVAISNATHTLRTFDLSGCILYTSCEPCPMCLAAIYWAKIDTVYYANTKNDAANIGFDDQFIYEEFAKPIEQRKVKMTQICHEIAIKSFEQWANKEDKIPY